jgi:hypothetical protein
MDKKGMTSYRQLETEFISRLLPILKKNGKKMMGWDEILQPGVPHDIMIQSWRGEESLVEAAKKGYTGLLSSGYYIDLIQPTDFHYLVDPVPANTTLTPEQQKLIVGGEATMWTEHVTPETVDSRIWPRTAAIAERFWSPANVRDVDDMYSNKGTDILNYLLMWKENDDAFQELVRRSPILEEASILSMNLARIAQCGLEAMNYIPTPAYGKVMLERDINLAQWIDSRFMPGKLYQGSWDPEGILSTFPSIVTGITGLLAGKLLLSVKSQEYRVIWLFFAGFISAIAGIVWNWFFPLNENIWTSSFVLFTSGLASMTLAASIFLVDILGYRKAAQFGVIYGMNAIAVYVLADIIALLFYLIKFGGSSLNEYFFNICTSLGFEPEFVSMVYALIYVWILFIPAYILYRKKIFITL